MSVDPRLLELLVCPACQGGLDAVDTPGLACRECGLVYPVRDGIPVMLVDEAERPAARASLDSDGPPPRLDT